jgi:hypothetical protein
MWKLLVGEKARVAPETRMKREIIFAESPAAGDSALRDAPTRGKCAAPAIM